MPTSFFGQNPNPTAVAPRDLPNFKLQYQNPTGGPEAPFDYSVGQWTPRYQNFINNLPVEYIKSKLGGLRNFTGMADPQIRNLAFGYANQLGYVGSPSVTAAMKGPSTPPPANAIFPQGYSPPPQYNAPIMPTVPQRNVTPTVVPTVTQRNVASGFRMFPAYNTGNRFRTLTR